MPNPKSHSTKLSPAIDRLARDLVAEVQSKMEANAEHADVALTSMLQALNATSDNCGGLAPDEIRSVLLSLMVTLTCGIVDSEVIGGRNPKGITALRFVELGHIVRQAADALDRLDTQKPFVRSSRQAPDPNAG